MKRQGPSQKKLIVRFYFRAAFANFITYFENILFYIRFLYTPIKQLKLAWVNFVAGLQKPVKLLRVIICSPRFPGFFQKVFVFFFFKQETDSYYTFSSFLRHVGVAINITSLLSLFSVFCPNYSITGARSLYHQILKTRQTVACNNLDFPDFLNIICFRFCSMSGVRINKSCFRSPDFKKRVKQLRSHIVQT